MDREQGCHMRSKSRTGPCLMELAGTSVSGKVQTLFAWLFKPFFHRCKFPSSTTWRFEFEAEDENVPQ